MLTHCLQYPGRRHKRAHGPIGYNDFKHYKPWLRDDFCFRCVFCLTRERWYPSGQDSFCVEHFRPKSRFSTFAKSYENLLYACLKCNVAKNEHILDINPCEEAMGKHLRVARNGRVLSKTARGAKLIDIVRLNRRDLLELRRMLLAVLPALELSTRPEDIHMLNYWRGFPTDLPDLRRMKPPGGNSRPKGASNCHLSRCEAGLLSELY